MADTATVGRQTAKKFYVSWWKASWRKTKGKRTAFSDLLGLNKGILLFGWYFVILFPLMNSKLQG